MYEGKLLMMKLKCVLAGACVAGLFVANAATTTDPEWEAGADVTIASGDTVILTQSTPELNSLTVSGTLSCSNWTTRVYAKTFTVKNKGVVTVPCAFTESQMSNRVYVVCEEFDLQSGGSINVDSKGYNYCNGPGRGGTVGNWTIHAAGHGGSGGAEMGTWLTLEKFGSAYGRPYGSAAEPVDPGSGSCGKATNWTGKPGGGAVYISASGHAKINGTISATGTGAVSNGYGGGSGGSVRIGCASVEGSGTISVAGGAPASVGTGGAGGGGGRISLTWTDSAAQAGYSPSIVFNCGGSASYVPVTGNRHGEAGTLYLTDSSFFPKETCTSSGRVIYANPPTQIHYSSLTVSTRSLEFEQPIPVVIDGDLMIKDGARFAVAGADVTVGGNVIVSGSASTKPATLAVCPFRKLTVGGTLTLGQYGYIRTDAGAREGADYGVCLDVKGDFTMSANSAWYPCSDPTNLLSGITLLRARSVTVPVDASISGAGRGWQLPYYSSAVVIGNGFGGTYFTGGADNSKILPAASHAGKGGYNSRAAGTRGGVYDDPKAPIWPGSSGAYGGSDNNKRGGNGGGEVWIEARKEISIDGTITMSGTTALAYGGSGSGGSIYLRASSIVGAGTISAKGGDVSSTVMGLPSNHWGYPAGGGGGGYITFRTDRDCSVADTFTGTISVDGGNAHIGGDYNEETGRYATDYRGWPGIVTYLRNPEGFMLLLK